MGKKIIALLSALFMVFSFVSCANNEQNVYVYGDEVHTAEPQTEETEAPENENYYEEVETTKKQVVTTKKQQTTKKQTTENNNSSGHVHNYSAASCTSPKTCSCGKTAGTALGHSYSSANCTSPKICNRCGATSGSALGHNFQNATCTSAKQCTRCGKTSGSALGHNYVNNKCSRCGKVDPDSLPVRLDALYLIDYSNGNSWHKYYYQDSSFTDSFGNVYDGAHCYVGVLNEGQYSIHNLNGMYSKFTGSIVAMQNTSTVDTYSIKIYVDDVLVYTKSKFSKTTGKIDFSVDVSGGTKLTIKVCTDNGKGDSNMSVAIVNAQLTK